MLFPVYQQFVLFKKFIRSPEDDCKDFIRQYEILRKDIELNVYSKCSEEQIQILNLLSACNLAIDDIENILSTLEDNIERGSDPYNEVKDTITEISNELERLPDSEITSEEPGSVNKLGIFPIHSTELDIAQVTVNTNVSDAILSPDKGNEHDPSEDQDGFPEAHLSPIENLQKPKAINNRTLVKCSHCDRIIRKNSMPRHIESAHKKLKDACSICGLKLSKRSMESHQKIHFRNSIEQIKCNECEYTTFTKDRMKLHNMNKHSPKNFACHICGNKFSREVLLRGHVNRVHAEMQVCPQCTYKTSCKESLDYHIASRHADSATAMCNYCGIEFESTDHQSLKDHIIQQHRKVDFADIKVAELEKNFDCDICGHKVNGKNALRLHKNAKHFGIFFYCDQCDYKTTTQYLLKMHVRKKHLKIKESKLRCKFCNFEAVGKTTLKRHSIVKHADQCKLYSCHLCNYNTFYKDLLRRHITGKYGKHSVKN